MSVAPQYTVTPASVSTRMSAVEWGLYDRYRVYAVPEM